MAYDNAAWDARIEALGKSAFMVVSCPDCNYPIPFDNSGEYTGVAVLCACGRTTTARDILSAHGLDAPLDRIQSLTGPEAAELDGRNEE